MANKLEIWGVPREPERAAFIVETFNHVSTEEMTPDAILRLRLKQLVRGTPTWARKRSYEGVPKAPPTPTHEQIERMTRDWNVIVNTLDCESGDWYERHADAEGAWHRIGFSRVYDSLLELGFHRSDHDEIIKALEQRDSSKNFQIISHRRGHKRKPRPLKRDKAEERAQRRTRLEAQEELEL